MQVKPAAIGIEGNVPIGVICIFCILIPHNAKSYTTCFTSSTIFRRILILHIDSRAIHSDLITHLVITGTYIPVNSQTATLIFSIFAKDNIIAQADFYIGRIGVFGNDYIAVILRTVLAIHGSREVYRIVISIYCRSIGFTSSQLPGSLLGRYFFQLANSSCIVGIRTSGYISNPAHICARTYGNIRSWRLVIRSSSIPEFSILSGSSRRGYRISTDGDIVIFCLGVITKSNRLAVLIGIFFVGIADIFPGICRSTIAQSDGTCTCRICAGTNNYYVDATFCLLSNAIGIIS